MTGPLFDADGLGVPHAVPFGIDSEGTLGDGSTPGVPATPTTTRRLGVAGSPFLRTWRLPDLRNGVTFQHITDTHVGAANEAQFAYDWMQNTLRDSEYMRIANNAGHLHTGDMIHWFTGANGADVEQRETPQYIAWRNSIRASTGLPWAEAVGNHDMVGPQQADGTRTERSAPDWAKSLGLGSANNSYNFNGVRVLTLAPQSWGPQNNAFTLGADNLAWLASQFALDPTTPTFIGCHAMLGEQYNPADPVTANYSSKQLTDLIASTPSLVGWISGHAHINIKTEARHAEVVAVGGRRLFVVNGPPNGGGRIGGVAYGDHQWQNVNQTIFLTYTGDALDVRWRDHNAAAWETARDATETHRLLRL